MSQTATRIYAIDHANKKSTLASRAVSKCLTAYHRAFDDELKKCKDRAGAHYTAKTAFRVSMPSMETREEIKAYIAVICAGMNLEVFNGRDASQMLYAAQVALSLLKEESKNEKTPAA